MQVNILVAQGILTTVLALLFAFSAAVSNAYWIFMTITTSVYLLMYLSMFVAAYNLRKRQPDHPRGYRAPALGLLCAVGFLSFGGNPDQLRPALTARLQRGRVPLLRRRRDHPARRDRPAALPLAPQAELEDR